MPKQFLEDMVIKTRRPEKKVRKVRKEPELKETWRGEKVIELETEYVPKKSRYLLWFVTLISVIICFFAVSFLFSKAEISVNPKTQDVTLNEKLSANKDSNDNELFFDLVAIPGQKSQNIEVTGEKDVENKAIGIILIYNAFNSSSQTLAIDTRLEGSNGKIYKTQTKVVVPGKSKNGTPGSVEVGIYGAEAGQDYNSSPLDFKIAGFKGTPKYTGFYGRSEGAIAGGFKGEAPAVSDADKAAATLSLKTALQAELLEKAAGQIPSGFVLFKDAVFLNTDDLDVPLVADGTNLTITLKGTLYGLLFNEQELTKKIAEDNISNYDESDVYIPNIENLTFVLSPGSTSAVGTGTGGTEAGTGTGTAGTNNISFDNVSSINFTLSGPATIVWKLDMNKFTIDLLGKSKNDFNQILTQYKNIASATLKISPMWKTSIPDDVKNIKVTVNYP